MMYEIIECTRDLYGRELSSLWRTFTTRLNAQRECERLNKYHSDALTRYYCKEIPDGHQEEGCIQKESK